MSRFTALDLPVPPERPKPSDEQVRKMLPAAERGYDWAVTTGHTAWSGATTEHQHKLVEVLGELWPVLAKDPGVALLPVLPPLPEGERYHDEFAARNSNVVFDMPGERLTVSVHGGGLAAAEQALLVALAMVRAAAAIGPPRLARRRRDGGLPVNPA